MTRLRHLYYFHQQGWISYFTNDRDGIYNSWNKFSSPGGLQWWSTYGRIRGRVTSSLACSKNSVNKMITIMERIKKKVLLCWKHSSITQSSCEVWLPFLGHTVDESVKCGKHPSIRQWSTKSFPRSIQRREVWIWQQGVRWMERTGWGRGDGG